MKTANLPLIREGSAKNIHRVDETDIAFRFTDWFSVFDVGRASYGIPGKAEAMCACAVKSFQVAEAIGIPTHFVEQMDDVTIRVKEAQIITDRALTVDDENYVVPAEFIYRLYVAGSIDRDFRSGKKLPESYGLPAGIIPAVGTPFPYPIHMFTTKFEDIDRELSDEAMCALAGLKIYDRDEYWSMIDRLIGACSLAMAQAGYAQLDGKCEPIMGYGRRKLIGDVFCTPDEDRPVPLDKLRRGIVEHHSKEYIRQLLIAMGYQDELDKARLEGRPDPPIPLLPEATIAEISRRYKAVANAYAGTRL
ncbi:MAG: phosphoribosylaminoimidazolesuccinocarboxamide synthase [bacterium]|nr:phosphoribosylaminoimidazolesuccinocarboxamide synthase [bacterium]